MRLTELQQNNLLLLCFLLIMALFAARFFFQDQNAQWLSTPIALAALMIMNARKPDPKRSMKIASAVSALATLMLISFLLAFFLVGTTHYYIAAVGLFSLSVLATWGLAVLSGRMDREQQGHL